ncbi:MAG: hypothetical protein K9G67_12465 [Bacteroidales bacterium]|nr:hypothetical protein [Bacteroidales bacterium]MCF8350604.1 hypothetical protein [Bacteroidales bacterium]MCF8377163.1 hypothetical protein [Bacteroidales bacterium]
MSAQNQIIRTSPENNATNVNVNTTVIEVELQQAAEPYMIMIMPDDRYEFPFVIGFREYEPAKMLHLEMEYLEPNLKYAIRFESMDEFEFPFKPYTLVFSTGQGNAGDNYYDDQYGNTYFEEEEDQGNWYGAYEENEKEKSNYTESEYANHPTKSIAENTNKETNMQGTSTGPEGTIKFKRVNEPRENAVSVVIPENWIIEGGVMRIPVTPYVNRATADVTLRDRSSTVLLHWFPDGYFITGSIYGSESQYGIPVKHYMSAEQFIKNEMFTKLRPNATGYTVIKKEGFPTKKQEYFNRLEQQHNANIDAAILTVDYLENGKKLREQFRTIIFKMMSPTGMVTWGNTESVHGRAPADEFDQWFTVFEIIANSIKVNQSWQYQEQQRMTQQLNFQNQRLMYDNYQVQQFVQQQQQMTNTVTQAVNEQQYGQDQLNEINSKFSNNVAGLEEYVNPYTGEAEIRTNSYDYRWVDPSGNEIYTNNPNLNPDVDMNLNGYQLSKPK